MGVVDAEFDSSTGMMGLVDDILDIPPALRGVELTTTITCNCVEANINYPFTVTGVLSAYYDDESVSNVDLTGFLQGATVKIYNGDSLLGTCVTGENGEYTFSHIVRTNAPLVLSAVFEGTDDYVSCFSENVEVNVSDYALLLTSDKYALSYYHRESASISAVLSDGNGFIENATLNYKIYRGDTLLDDGSCVTNANGEVSLTYASNNRGDIRIIFSFGTLLSETIIIEDCEYYNDGSNISDLIYTNAIVSTDGDAISLSAPESQQSVKLPFQLNSNSRKMFEYEVVSYDAQYTVQFTSSWQFSISTGSRYSFLYYWGSRSADYKWGQGGFPTAKTIGMMTSNNNVSLCADGVSITTGNTHVSLQGAPTFLISANKSLIIKNIKLKQL